MQATFGYAPKVGMKASLKKAIDFFVEEHKAMVKVVDSEA